MSCWFALDANPDERRTACAESPYQNMLRQCDDISTNVVRKHRNNVGNKLEPSIHWPHQTNLKFIIKQAQLNYQLEEQAGFRSKHVDSCQSLRFSISRPLTEFHDLSK